MPPIHIALRVSASASNGAEDPFEAHAAVLEANGAVLFGKVGRPMGTSTMALVNEQVERGIPTYLFLAAPAAMRMRVFRGQVEAVGPATAQHDAALVPAYYKQQNLTARIGSWFRLSSLERDEVATLRGLVNAKSGRPVLSLFAASRSSMFLVAPAPGTRLTALTR